MSGAPWFEPDWPNPPGVRALCTWRGADAEDGASRGGWSYFNLGAHVGDDPDAVAANRARLAQAGSVRPVYLQQVHGKDVVVLDSGSADAQHADAAMTTAQRLACTIMVADCLPVLFASSDGRCVAAAHAGWRGLSGGVLEATLARMRAGAGESAAAARCQAWLGPCIGPTEFEVGAEVLAAFTQTAPEAARCFHPGARPGKFLADLAGLARQRLRRAGVTRLYGNDSGRAWCTVLNPQRYYSYRYAGRTGGGSGRMAACIWRT